MQFITQEGIRAVTLLWKKWVCLDFDENCISKLIDLQEFPLKSGVSLSTRTRGQTVGLMIIFYILLKRIIIVAVVHRGQMSRAVFCFILREFIHNDVES